MEPPSPNRPKQETYTDGGEPLDRVSTGLQVLDQRLGGGFPIGSTVALLGPPTAPSELYCHQLALAHAEGGKPSLTNSVDVQRSVLYVATDAPTRRAAPDNDAITYYDHLPEALDEFESHKSDSKGSGPAPLIVVDRFSDLLEGESVTEGKRQAPNEDVDWFNSFRELSELVATGDTLALVHLHIPDDRAYTRAESRILSMADAVLNYQSPLTEDTADRISIPKIRGAAPPEDRVPLEVSEKLDINPDRQL